MSEAAHALDEVTPEIVRHIEEALAAGNSTEAKALLEALSASAACETVSNSFSSEVDTR